MTNRRTLSFSVIAAALLALCLPAVAAAQYGRYDDRYLRNSIQRLDRLAKDFEKELDRSLDHSRVDGTRREDQINGEARQFRNAVSDLKSRFGNGRDLNRSRNEAQRVLQEAREVERIGIGRARSNNNRLGSVWSEIRQELNVISQAYGSYGYDNGDYRNGRRNPNNNNDWWRRLPIPR